MTSDTSLKQFFELSSVLDIFNDIDMEVPYSFFICKQCFNPIPSKLVRAKMFNFQSEQSNKVISVVKYCDKCTMTTTQEFVVELNEQRDIVELSPIILVNSVSA